MKRFTCHILVLLLGLLFATPIYAQQVNKNPQLDSLLSVSQTYSKDDTVKIELWIEIARWYSHLSAYPASLEYYLKALTLAEKLGDLKRQVNLLGNVGVEYTSLGNYLKALEYHQRALAIAEQNKQPVSIAYSLNQIGRVYMFLPDYPMALMYYKRALALSEKSGSRLAHARHLRNIGNTYGKMANYAQSLSYLMQAKKLFESLGNKEGDAITLGIIGDVYTDSGNYAMALIETQKAIQLNTQNGNKRQLSLNMLTKGRALYYAPDSALIKMGIKPEERQQKSIETLIQGQQLAREIGDAGTEKRAWEELSRLYENQEQYLKAYQAYKMYILYRDSVSSLEIKNTMALKEMQYDFDKRITRFEFEKQLHLQQLREQEVRNKQQQQEIGLKQHQLLLSRKEKDLVHLGYLKTLAELELQKTSADKQRALNAQKDAEMGLLVKEKDLQSTALELTQSKLIARENQRNGLVLGAILLMVLAIAIFIGFRRTAKERKKSELLLLNILPSEVVQELKQTGTTVAKQYNHVTVLFTDFVNFTGITEQMTPTELVSEIHQNFVAFDTIIEKYGLEKIKTIGDAYLAVCGLPNEVEDHAQRVVNASKEIRDYMINRSGKFQVRIGIHTGPVVAGIVGVKKYAYDIWGDTVNMAARMEQHSEANKINISSSTYQLVQHEIKCEYRGKIQAKHKGEVDMYFVN